MFGQSATEVLVYGWYNKGNIGDELFKDAFKHLFPDLNFTFVARLTTELLQKTSIVFFGGGSYLHDRPNFKDEDLKLLQSKKIFFIGTGIEAGIHPIYIDLMVRAKLIATRSFDQVDRIKKLNPNTIYIPDIVYSLQSQIYKSTPKNKSVLVIPNISVVPKWNDINWKHASWNYFKSEFSQFLDFLVEDGFKLNFFPMCRNSSLDDQAAAIEIINMMDHRDISYPLQDKPQNIIDITKLWSKYQFIITQRFHGIVLSEMTKIPYLAIHHHDKLKNSIPHNGKYVSYYGTYKQELIDQFNSLNNMKYSSSMPVDLNVFKILAEEVMGFI